VTGDSVEDAYQLGIATGEWMERERIIALLDSEHSEFTAQHQGDKKMYIDDCAACFALALIKGDSQ